MIDNRKIEVMIDAEIGKCELYLNNIQAVIDDVQARHDRISKRLAAFPAAVMARGPFKTQADVYMAVNDEAQFVIAAASGGH